MTLIRALLVALLLAIASSTAAAASFSTDQSDLWWADPPGSENGWGFQLVQRNSTIFITMFVYGPVGTPTWYVATMAPTGASFQWSGDLFATTGPWFGAVPYNPALVALRKVGTVTWTSTSVVAGILQYAVDGVQVTKNATRQTLVAENYNGHFGAVFHEVVSGCANVSFDNTAEGTGVLNIAQNGSAVAMTFSNTNGATCTYNGTLGQFGQMGSIVTSYACSNGAAGTYQLFEIQVTEFNITARFASTSTVATGCQSTGWLSGSTVTTF